MQRYDVAIVGASLAGSSLAIRLARQGLNVALFDSQHFPRRKACGEGISKLGLCELDGLNLRSAFERLPHTQLSGYAIFDVSAPQSHSPLIIAGKTAEEPLCYGVQRLCLDNLLFETAAAWPGVHAYSGEKVASISPGTKEVVLRTECREVVSSFAVLACGAAANLLQCLPAAMYTKQTSRAGFSYHVRGTSSGPQRNLVSILLAKDCQIFCTPVGNDEFNISIMTGKKLTALGGPSGLRSLAAELIKNELGLEIKETDRMIGAAAIGKSRRPAFAGRLLLAGDALEQLDPVGGMGMAHALVSSRLAAEALVAVFAGEKSIAEAGKNYAAARERAMRPFRGFTWLTYLFLVELQNTSLNRILNRSPLPRAASAAVHAAENEALWTRVSKGILSTVGGMA